MRNLIIALTLFLVGCQTSPSQPAEIMWERTYGGSDVDLCRSAKNTLTGDVVLFGYTYSFGSGDRDILAVAIDADGDSLWSSTLGGPATENAGDLRSDESGIIVVGSTSSFGSGDRDGWCVKLTSGGDSVWSRYFGGNAFDSFASISASTDSGYIIAGRTASFGQSTSLGWVVKINENGDSLWTQTFGGAEYSEFTGLLPLSDSGYILIGSTSSFGADSLDGWIVKIDQNGNGLWNRVYGASGYDVFTEIRPTNDGGFILVGFSESIGQGQNNLWLMKIDSNGNSLWSRTYGGNAKEEGHSIIVLDDGFLVCGSTESYAQSDRADGWILRVDQNGDSLWSLAIGGPGLDGFFEAIQVSEEEFILTGTKSTTNSLADFWALKLSTLISGVDQRKGYLPDEEGLHQNYPNPFNPTTEIRFDLPEAIRVELKIFNILGQEVATLVDDVRSAGAYRILWDGKNAGGLSVASGVYVYQIKTSNFQDAKKMVLIR